MKIGPEAPEEKLFKANGWCHKTGDGIKQSQKLTMSTSCSGELKTEQQFKMWTPAPEKQLS